jgi:hypothetical protein
MQVAEVAEVELEEDQLHKALHLLEALKAEYLLKTEM